MNPMHERDLPITRCPHCRTAYRVRETQLIQRRGMVRCGACRGVFNAIQHMLRDAGNTITITPPPDDSPAPGVNPPTLMAGNHGKPAPASREPVPTATVDLAPSSSPVGHLDPPAARAATDSAAPPVSTPQPVSDAPAHGPAGTEGETLAVPNTEPTSAQAKATPTKQDVPAGDAMGAPATDAPEATLTGKSTARGRVGRIEREDSEYRWRKPAPVRKVWSTLWWSTVSVLLVLLLPAQAAYWFRNELVARFPALRDPLTQACATVGCRIAPPVRRGEVVIEAAELTPDPSHAGLHVLSGLLRNRYQYPSAYPSLVVTLMGVNNEPLTRRIFLPHEYLGATADLKAGLPGRGEMEFKLFLDASAINPVGFDVRVAYDEASP